jgi:hypothetical protein
MRKHTFTLAFALTCCAATFGQQAETPAAKPAAPAPPQVKVASREALIARAKSPAAALDSASLSCCACRGVIIRSQPALINASSMHKTLRCIAHLITAAFKTAMRNQLKAV